MDKVSLKIELRRRLHEEVAALPDDYLAYSNEGLYQRAIALKVFADARNIMMFHSVGREADTLKIAKAAFDAGKTVAFPYCFRGGRMQAHAVKSLSELKPAMLGIPAPPDTAPIIAPAELDLIIVPALAYDRTGYRIGYGGGYYDRFLSGIAAYTVGLARERLLLAEMPKEPHDIAVKCVITENAAFYATEDH